MQAGPQGFAVGRSGGFPGRPDNEAHDPCRHAASDVDRDDRHSPAAAGLLPARRSASSWHSCRPPPAWCSPPPRIPAPTGHLRPGLGFGASLVSITVDQGIAYLLYPDRPREVTGREAGHEIWSAGLFAIGHHTGGVPRPDLSGYPLLGCRSASSRGWPCPSRSSS